MWVTGIKKYERHAFENKIPEEYKLFKKKKGKPFS
jgi:hypothetical protein